MVVHDNSYGTISDADGFKYQTYGDEAKASIAQGGSQTFYFNPYSANQHVLAVLVDGENLGP